MERQPNPDDPAYRDQSTRRSLEEKKSKTSGQQLEEEGGYLDTGELDQEGKPLLSKEIDVESLTNRQKQKQDAEKWKEFDDAVAGAKSKEDLIEAGKIRKRLEGNWVSLATLAGETFIGIGADVFLPSPDPLSRGLNYGIGYGTNVFAQWLRGEEFSQGQAHAAGLFQAIPFGTVAKGAKGITRAIGKGAVGGVVGEQVRVGIDEKRVLTPEEVGYAGTFGGAFGGLTKGALDNVDLTSLKSRLSKQRQVVQNLDGTLSIADDGIDLAKQSAQPMRMAGAQVNPTKAAPKLSTNERLKQSLIANEVIELPPAYKGGPVTFRPEADFFDVSAALIGGGQEDARDALGRKIDYNRAKVTEFGATRSERRDMVFNHIKDSLRRNKKDGTGTNITRKEFNEYAKEQVAAEKDLRKAIKLLNIRSYASLKNIDLSDYPTSEAQLELLNKINKAKVKPRRSKNDTTQQFQNKLRKWERDTAPYQQYTDYKETFDYGHIISAKTGFRLEDLGMNRISNTEIEAAHNIASYDPYTKKIIEILQEGNRERGSRRDYLPVVQRMRNTAGSVVEDFVKWKANKDNDPVNLTKILDKFIPRDQHDNYLQFIQKKFYQKRSLGYATIKEFVEEVYGFDYKIFKDLPQKHKNKVEKEYLKQRVESGNVTGKQQYDQAGEWMLEAIDEFIGLHHLSKPKKLPKQEDIDLPQNIDDLMDMILPDRLPDE